MAVKVVCVRGVSIEGDPVPLATAPVRIVSEQHAGWGGGWVAKVTAVDPNEKGGLRRTFLRPCARNLSRRGNGTVTFEVQEPGVYEVEYVRRSFERARVFLSIQEDGSVAILGHHQPGTRRSEKLEQAIAAALGHEPSQTPAA